MGETPWTLGRRAPMIGEHNHQIYLEELGLSRDELLLLKHTGAI
jgi:crotonobetainyl-CoA:carnitine CoA-transferase CaiB-like acyl-CoA transferase